MKRYIALNVALALGICASAQNINPTVQVTNAYEGKLMEVHKQELQMNVPDSLLQFDWQFDYSVFDQPYKGAYDFNPYLIDMKPEAVASSAHSLYLRGGAGYSLHPEAQLIFSPYLSDKFVLSVYDDFKGYWGNYSSLYSEGPSDNLTTTVSDATAGHEMTNRIGTAARYTMPHAIFSLGAGFDLLRASHPQVANSAQAGDVSLGIKSQQTEHWDSELSVSYRGLSLTDQGPFSSKVNELAENTVKAGAEVLRHYGDHVTFGLSAGYDRVWQDTTALSLLKITPMFRLEGGRLNLHTGLLFSVPSRTGAGSHVFKGNICYPQIYADWLLIPDTMKVYIDFTGGDFLSSYSSLLRSNVFASPYGPDYIDKDSPQAFGILDLYDSSKRSFDISGGVKGRFGARVQYQASLGAYRLRNALAESMMPQQDITGLLFPCYVRADMTVAYFDLKASWSSSSFDADGEFRYQGATRLSEANFIIPAPISGHFNATYNWNGRIYFGAGVKFASERRERYIPAMRQDASYDLSLPGYCDLGVNAEYKATRQFSIWALGGNLLGHPVYENALFVRKGAYFTIGITLDL